MSTDEPATRARESHALSMRWKEFECGNEGGVKNNTERLKFTLLQVIHLPSFRFTVFAGQLLSFFFICPSRHIASESGL